VRSTTAGNAAQRHELARVAAERSVTPASSVRVGHEVVRSGDLIAPADLGRNEACGAENPATSCDLHVLLHEGRRAGPTALAGRPRRCAGTATDGRVLME
jgi:hypothetical protein